MTGSLDVKVLLGVSWRRVGVPLLGLCAGLAAAHAVTQFLPPRYEAQASILVTATATEPERPANLGLAQNLAPTIARLVESREVALDAAAELRLPEKAVRGHVHGDFELGLQIITVQADARSAGQAAEVANAVGRAVSRHLGRLEIGGETRVTARLLDTASPPGLPAFPKPLLNGALGALAGLLAGWGAVTLRDRFDSRLRQTGQIESRLGLPVVGVLPQLPRRFARHHATALYARAEVRDAVRATISTISVLTAHLPRRRLLVTSAHDDDGKALVAALLGMGLADEHCWTTLVDGAVRDPVLSGHFPDAPYTWQQVLEQRVTPVRLPDLPTLTVLPAEPGDSIDTDAITDLGALLTAWDEDCVLVHVPPILAGREVSAFARQADGVLLVVEAGRTNLADSSRAARLIRRLGLPVAGVVVTGAVARTDHRAAGDDLVPTDLGATLDTPVLPGPRASGGSLVREFVAALVKDSSSAPGRHRQHRPNPVVLSAFEEGHPVTDVPAGPAAGSEPSAAVEFATDPPAPTPVPDPAAGPAAGPAVTPAETSAAGPGPDPSSAPPPGPAAGGAATVWPTSTRSAAGVDAVLRRPLARPEPFGHPPSGAEASDAPRWAAFSGPQGWPVPGKEGHRERPAGEADRGW